VNDTPAADAALDHPHRRERLLARLERVNAAVSQDDGWEADRHLPPELQRESPRPSLPREALTGLHLMLVEELARLEEVEGSR
jgi:hypothetical protein